jgi:hypothetical protein
MRDECGRIRLQKQEVPPKSRPHPAPQRPGLSPSDKKTQSFGETTGPPLPHI